MVTESDLHTSVVLLVASDGYPAGTEGFLIDVAPLGVVVEIDRPGDNPDVVMVGCGEVRPLEEGSRAA